MTCGTIFRMCYMQALCFEKISKPPLSHRSEIEISDFSILENLQAIFPFIYRRSKQSLTECAAFIVLSSARITIGLLDIGI